MTLEYTDQEVVAAFNSCLDLDKYNALPEDVRARFELLLCKNRVKAVCFMCAEGLGLRVHLDALAVEKQHSSDDEVTTENGTVTVRIGQKKGQVDVTGHWLRCPPDLWKPKEWFLVMRDDGKAYYRETESDPDEDESEESLSPLSDGTRWEWSEGCGLGARGRATRVDGRGRAESIAGQVGGVVIKH